MLYFTEDIFDIYLYRSENKRERESIVAAIQRLISDANIVTDQRRDYVKL